MGVDGERKNMEVGRKGRKGGRLRNKMRIRGRRNNYNRDFDSEKNICLGIET